MPGTSRAIRTLLFIAAIFSPVLRPDEDLEVECKDIAFTCDMKPMDGDLLPVFFVHGIQDDACQARLLFEHMKLGKRKPTYACAIPLFQNLISVTFSLAEQTDKVINFIRAHAVNMTEYQIVCHSMGGLTCRGILQQMDDHRVSNAVITAGALEGVYGPLGNNPMVLQLLHTLHGVVSMGFLQNHISGANLIHDPLNHEEYLTNNKIIPLLDGYQKASEGDEEYKKRLKRYKTNWQRVKKVHLLASPEDDMVLPWQSAHFGFYRQGSETDVVPFTELKVDATLGLSEMKEQGRLELVTVRDVKHVDWTYNSRINAVFVYPRLASYEAKEDQTAESKDSQFG